MNISSLMHSTSLGSVGKDEPACSCEGGGNARTVLRATCRGKAQLGSVAIRRTKASANQFTQMCAVPKSRFPVLESTASAVTASISEYSNTHARPCCKPSTPTRSCACAFGTVLEAHSAPSRTQYPTNIGSARRQRALSTHSWKKEVTPCVSSLSSSPLLSSELYTPPFPSGAIATRPAPSTRISPSKLRHGSIPCSKKCTSAGGSPKCACSAKKREVASCVASDVITASGSRTVDTSTPAAAAASWRTRSSRSAWYWKSDLPEGIPMS
mmetsp:Transcript_7623/g.18111  ORF Transcript_7623/g.18111 Transcript_7623/m.18111 type:complete len:269 (+) Transcript_7623:379-1185(+)